MGVCTGAAVCWEFLQVFPVHALLQDAQGAVIARCGGMSLVLDSVLRGNVFRVALICAMTVAVVGTPNHSLFAGLVSFLLRRQCHQHCRPDCFLLLRDPKFDLVDCVKTSLHSELLLRRPSKFCFHSRFHRTAKVLLFPGFVVQRLI